MDICDLFICMHHFIDEYKWRRSGVFVVNFKHTVFTRKSVYAGKSASLELAPPFDVKYLTSACPE